MRTVALLVSVALAASGCAGGKTKSGGKPDWVDGQSKQYSDAHYIIGRGQADRADDAKDRARADLAKVFRVAVNEYTSDKQTFSSKTAGGKTTTTGSLDVERHVQTYTDEVLTGVKIGDLWKNPKTKEHHALAVLSRMQAKRMLEDKIKELDDATSLNMQKAGQAQDLIDKIAAASRAMQAQGERSAAQAALQVVDRMGKGVPPVHSMAKLTADYDSLLARMKIKPEAEGELLNALSGALATAGFMVEQEGSQNHVMTATQQLEDLGRRDGWFWLRATVEVQLKDSQGRVRGSERWQFKESATDAGSARMRLNGKVADALKKDMRATVIKFAAAL